jgi:hypothetical protein
MAIAMIRLFKPTIHFARKTFLAIVTLNLALATLVWLASISADFLKHCAMRWEYLMPGVLVLINIMMLVLLYAGNKFGHRDSAILSAYYGIGCLKSLDLWKNPEPHLISTHNCIVYACSLLFWMPAIIYIFVLRRTPLGKAGAKQARNGVVLGI